jgi:roadblock/LC7 domain-containing protein
MSQSIKNILDEQILDDGIEFAGMISKHGRLVDCKNRSHINLSKEQKEMFFMSCSLQQRMSEDYDDDFGKVQYMVTEREDYRIITVPQESDTLIFVMDKHGAFFSRVRKLLKAINHMKNLESRKNLDGV